MKYSMHPDPGRSFFEYKDNNKLSTFASSGSSSPRIILNPCDVAYESSLVGHRNDSFTPNEVNHYLDSEELCKLPLNNSFNTDNRSKVRQDLPIRYNMSLSSDFAHNNGNHWNHAKRHELSIHDQFVKNKVHNKKRNSRPAVDITTETSDHRWIDVELGPLHFTVVLNQW